jgi:hypothetical protein
MQVSTCDATIRWLIEEDNPSVRYLALTQLLGRPENDADVLSAKRDIMAFGPVPAILASQEPGGFWGTPDRYYLDKYTGSAWQLLMLAELCADGEDARVRKACEFILESAQDRQSFGFAVNRGGQGGGRHSEVIPCLSGNMVYSLIKLGYISDGRVQGGIDWIVRYQRADDGISTPPAGWPYDRYEICFGRHTCHMGAAKALKALFAIPAQDRTGAVNAKIAELAEYFLVHHIYKKSHDLKTIAKPGWTKFGFPLMYQSDALELLFMLSDLGIRDPRMDEALDLVLSKRQDGRWRMENTFNGKMRVDIEAKGDYSKWITLRALLALRCA